MGDISPSFIRMTMKSIYGIHIFIDRCQKRINLLRVMAGASWGASKTTLLIAYKALIRSVIDYGSEAYNAASK